MQDAKNHLEEELDRKNKLLMSGEQIGDAALDEVRERERERERET